MILLVGLACASPSAGDTPSRSNSESIDCQLEEAKAKEREIESKMPPEGSPRRRDYEEALELARLATKDAEDCVKELKPHAPLLRKPSDQERVITPMMYAPPPELTLTDRAEDFAKDYISRQPKEHAVKFTIYRVLARLGTWVEALPGPVEIGMGFALVGAATAANGVELTRLAKDYRKALREEEAAKGQAQVLRQRLEEQRNKLVAR